MAFTEFTCRSGGSNMNGGRLNSNGEAPTSAAYSATNGGWNSGTGLFTPASGTTTGVTVGDFAHVFTDGSTTPTFIGRVTAKDTAGVNITVSTSVKIGTAPTTAGTGISINVGGAWAGPSGAVAFPFGAATLALTDSSTNRPRINLKNDQTYNITAAMVQTSGASGPVKFQGYTSTFGDGGRATIDGGTSGASYTLFANASAPQVDLEDIIFQNNGATGSATLVDHTTGGNAFGLIRRCVFAHSRGIGLNIAQGVGTVVECEAYDCNQSNTANLGAFTNSTNGTIFNRCIAHDNTAGANAHGFVFSTITRFNNCISESNGGSGYKITSGTSYSLVNCDAYNNTGDGFTDGTAGATGIGYIENSNFVKNGGYGINLVGGMTVAGMLVNNGFGSGTMANTSGQTNLTTGTDMIEVVGSVTYASGVTPWVDPDNGDFRINLAAAKNAGRGAFTQTAASYTGAIAYPDIGAAQHLDAGGSSGPVGKFISAQRGTPY